jgi:hypothetical protein
MRRAVLAACVAGAALGVLPRRALTADVTPAAADSGGSAAATLQPRIVNGRDTWAYPATGALLLFDDAGASSLAGLCSGTLIGCRTFLTAAHCVCPEAANDAATCERLGTADPLTLRVFLQRAGLFRVAQVAVDPDYAFAQRGDVALVTLSESVTGIAPSPINTSQRPEPNTPGTIVGFGTTLGGRRNTNDSGMKREGTVTTAICPTDIPSATHVCWLFTGTDSNTCGGDSGGPLFVNFGSGALIAGVTSGGESPNCLAPDAGFDSDVFVNQDWIVATAGADLGTESCDLPPVGSALTEMLDSVGDLTSQSEARLQVDVPEGATWLRVGLNGQVASGSGPSTTANDFDLFVRAGSAPTADAFDCADAGPTTFGFCEFAAPHPGPWYVWVRRNRGQGGFQVTTTTFAAALMPACTGDCNRDGAVTVDDVLTGVDIALGTADITSCPSFDGGGAGVVTVDTVITAVRYALSECPVS